MPAELPHYLESFMEDCPDLLATQNTEPSEENTTTLLDTTYGLRVTKTEQDGGIWFNFSLVPSPSSINAHPQGKKLYYKVSPAWDPLYLFECDPDADERKMQEPEVDHRFPNIAERFHQWSEQCNLDMEAQMYDASDSERDFKDDVHLMDWKIEGFFMACWMALQPDVEGVEYDTPVEKYSLRKNDNNLDLEFQRFINSDYEPFDAHIPWPLLEEDED